MKHEIGLLKYCSETCLNRAQLGHTFLFEIERLNRTYFSYIYDESKEVFINLLVRKMIYDYIDAIDLENNLGLWTKAAYNKEWVNVKLV
jgi:hypothetical protein